MRSFSRTLIYVLFIVVIFFFFSLRAQRSRTEEIAKVPLVFFAKRNSWQGEVVFKRRADKSQFLILKLNAKVPGEMIVLLVDQDGLAREIGRFKGATFVTSLPPSLHYEKVKKVVLQTTRKGNIWAEALINQQGQN